MNSAPKRAAVSIAFALFVLLAAGTSYAAERTTYTKEQPRAATAGAFAAFVRDIRGCRSTLGLWRSVIKPKLESLGYTADEIGRTKAALQDNAFTMGDVRVFCLRWAYYHHERLDCNRVYADLAAGCR